MEFSNTAHVDLEATVNKVSGGRNRGGVLDQIINGETAEALRPCCRTAEQCRRGCRLDDGAIAEHCLGNALGRVISDESFKIRGAGTCKQTCGARTLHIAWKRERPR